MQRYGKTSAGTQRYFCVQCKTTGIKTRKDTEYRHERSHFIKWLSGERSEKEIAKELGISRQTLSGRFSEFFKESWGYRIPQNLSIHTLIVDGTYIQGNVLCVLVALSDTGHIFWRFAMRETGYTWNTLLSRIPVPSVVVCDGQRGLIKVIHSLWPDVRIQRCHFHVVSFAIQKLTRKPKNKAEKEILHHLYKLKDVHTKEDKEKWIFFFRIWEKQHHKVLIQRNENGVYTNRNLRSVRFLIRHALPDLFTCLEYENVPSTTNLVEGWINTRIAEGIRQHRGLKPSQKKTLVSIILQKLSAEKPTRKFT